MTDHEEKRGYFRIDDVIGLNYSALESDEEFPKHSEEDVPGNFIRLLDEIDVALNRAVNNVWQQNPATAQALGLLNRKLNLIAEQCPQQVEPAMGNFEEQTASISGSGMAFTIHEKLPVASRLGLSVVLKPSNIQLRFTATVVDCEWLQDIPNELYLLRIKIDECNIAEKEQLVQHVVQKQQRSLNPDDSEQEMESH